MINVVVFTMFMSWVQKLRAVELLFVPTFTKFFTFSQNMIFQLKTCISSRGVFKFETFVDEGWVWSNQNWNFELIIIRTVESMKRWDATNEMQHLLFQQIYNKKYLICTEWKVSVFGNFLVLIFPHLHWMQRVWR